MISVHAEKQNVMVARYYVKILIRGESHKAFHCLLLSFLIYVLAMSQEHSLSAYVGTI